LEGNLDSMLIILNRPEIHIDAPDWNGFPALHFALQSSAKMASVLLLRGAQFSILNTAMISATPSLYVGFKRTWYAYHQALTAWFKQSTNLIDDLSQISISYLFPVCSFSIDMSESAILEWGPYLIAKVEQGY
jgi:hypothetical protein